MAINPDSSEPVASSSKTILVPGPTTFHESSQFRHWRYSQSQLRDLRLALNAKSVEVVTRNSELEKVCGNSWYRGLSGDYTDCIIRRPKYPSGTNSRIHPLKHRISLSRMSCCY